MKIFALALATVSALSLATAAQARPDRIYCGDLNDGAEYCLKPVGTDSAQMTLNDKFDGTGFTAVMNCSTGQMRTRDVDGHSANSIRSYMNIACD